MNNKIVLHAAPIHEVLKKGLEELSFDVISYDQLHHIDASNVLGLVTSNKLSVTSFIIDQFPNLEFIGRLGSGMEIIDVAYATTKGIKCMSSPDGNCDAVADHAIGLLLNLTKYIQKASCEVKDKQVWLRDVNKGVEISELVVAIIGFGHTGKAFARRLSGFGCEIIAVDIDDEVVYPSYVRKVTLTEVFQKATVLSFHLPSNSLTNHYYNDLFAKKMLQNHYIINTSRGNVIDYEVLINNIRYKKVLGAGLDVYQQEPPNFKTDDFIQQLLSFENVLMTPHIAGYSFFADFKMNHSIFQQIQRLYKKGL